MMCIKLLVEFLHPLKNIYTEKYQVVLYHGGYIWIYQEDDCQQTRSYHSEIVQGLVIQVWICLTNEMDLFF